MMWATILAGLETYSAEIASVTGIGVLLGWVFKPWRKSKKTDLSDETIEKIAPAQVKDGTTLTVPEFIRLRRELKADLEDELTRADETEKTRLRARITELESQIANPDAALAELQKLSKIYAPNLKGPRMIQNSLLR
ncbi:hypothetical protein OAN307_c11920 [Octadecabacter antarcticus 307]|uniref:Uncharacterized protein n=1 Tax=Octadecabacter antarcticus 307 TaxID=391626 RepID=M9R548_9RHOB|nr:hypothetical protein [Octadecabacter antarcticus]AGI66893.1 hypothetical protein OAN307_c11920 [Octadecabacter antarcticus 307]